MKYSERHKSDIKYLSSEESLNYFSIKLFRTSKTDLLRSIWNGFLLDRAAYVTSLFNKHIYFLLSQKPENSKNDLFFYLYLNSKKLLEELSYENYDDGDNLIELQSYRYKNAINEYQLLCDKYKRYYSFRVNLLRHKLNCDITNYILCFIL